MEKSWKRLSQAQEQAFLWINDNCSPERREATRELLLMLDELSRREMARLLLQRVPQTSHYHGAMQDLLNRPKMEALIRELGGLT